MEPAALESLLEQVREVTTALRQGELARANEMLAACRLAELAASGELPAGPEGAPIRAAVQEALTLAVGLQETRRTAIAQGGTTRRALGAYGRRR